MTFQNKGVDFSFFVGEWSEREGTGDVGRSTDIMRAAVEQQETPGSERRVAAFVRFVVYDGTVGTVSGDGAEGKTAKIGVFCAKRGKSLFNGEFRFLCDLAFFDDFIERSAKTHQCHAVQFHRTTETGDLAFVFHRAQSGNRGNGRSANGAQTQLMEMFHDLSVHASCISDECLSYVERTQQLCGAFVRMQRDSVRSQLFLCAFIERFEMNEKVSFAFAYQ